MKKSILVTGASGKTGQAIIKRLSSAGWICTAFTHKSIYESELLSNGAQKVIIGDLRNENDLQTAIKGMNAVYHICPNMTPDEKEIGYKLIRIVEKQSNIRFIYHSVLHPQISSMPHHWQKMQVEEELFKSNVEYSILQPTAYMQNLSGYKQFIVEGIYPVPYDLNASISLVDLRDVAEAALQVLSNPLTVYGIFELVGTPPLSQYQVAEYLSKSLSYTIKPVCLNRDEWAKNAIAGGMAEYARKTLIAMFEYYDVYGLKGSPKTLTCLIDKNPITIEQYIQEEFKITSK
jgi:uncharacterized protein YbjT (DUF2867 family)